LRRFAGGDHRRVGLTVAVTGPTGDIGISAVEALERGRGSRGPAGADSPGSGVGGVGRHRPIAACAVGAGMAVCGPHVGG